MELEDIKGKIDTFFTRKGIDTRDRYFIVKALMDDYWESIRDDEDIEPEEELDDFEDDDMISMDPKPPIPVPKPPKNHKAGIASLVKKPKVSTK